MKYGLKVLEIDTIELNSIDEFIDRVKNSPFNVEEVDIEYMNKIRYFSDNDISKYTKSKFFTITSNTYKTNLTYIIILEDVEKTYAVDFDIYEVSSFEVDNDIYTPTIDSDDRYLKAQIKFDGSTHIWVGDDEEDTGYIYTDIPGIYKHMFLMNTLINIAKQQLSNLMID